MKAENPYLAPQYGTPSEPVPFDRIGLEHYEPAILEGMRQEDEAIERILSNPEEPTFENTIAPRTDRILERVTTVMFNLISAHTNDEMDALAERITPLLTEHSNRIALNPALFRKVKHVYENRHTLDAEQQRLTEKAYTGFVRNGANLKDEDKEEFARIETELSSLTLEFNRKLLKEMNAFRLIITDETQLSGIPERQREQAATAAKEAGTDGWLFTLHAPSFIPFMTYADARPLRREMYMARNTLCFHGDEFDNTDTVRRIVDLRRQKALLLGYNTYAEYALERRMAADTAHVYDLLDTLLEASLHEARKEQNEQQRLARDTAGNDIDLQP